MRTILPPKHRLVPSDAKKVFQGQIFDVYQWEQQLYDGTTKTFEMLKRPDNIQVLAVKDDKLVVVYEEQPSMGPAFYGLPGGRHDVESETELQAAQRELREETGMEFRNWRLVNVYQKESKIEWFNYLFVASDFISQGETHHDPGEKIEVKLVTLDEARSIARGPQSRHLALDILDRVEALEDLAQLPEFHGINIAS